MNIYDLFHNNIKSEYVLLFDLDGTLLDTDMANNCAYEYALYKITGQSDYAALSGLRRITRKDVAVLDGVGTKQLEDIINMKQDDYEYQLRQGRTMPFITEDILKRSYMNHKCFLITSADKNRAEKLIQYYQLQRYFQDIIFVNSDDKYKDISTKLSTDVTKIILFENDPKAIENAFHHGVLKEHMVNISDSTLKKHIIRQNNFLRHDTLAFYHMCYMGYGKPNNPDFINDLKNQFRNVEIEQLKSAANTLVKYLVLSIDTIYNILEKEELVVIAIPRAKSEDEYHKTQQLFRQGISYSVNWLRENRHLNLINGSHFIIRHTNTKTTHLSKCQTIVNDGEMPYVGITHDTCNISDDVVGKDILLIDDIYTKNVNIDEDAIQALYDEGARSVTFYSICRTYKK